MPLGLAPLDGPLGLACVLIGLYHIGLLLSRRSRFAPGAAHAAMGLGMAAMFVPAADPVPRPLWVAVFVVIAAWFGAASIRAGSLLGDAGHHAIGAVAMVYMLLAHGAVGTAGPADPEHAHHGGAGGAAPPLLMVLISLGFAAWFIADVVRLLVRRGGDVSAVPAPQPVGAGAPDGAAPPGRVAARWRVGVLPDVVMSAAMAVMFLGMA